MIACVVDPRVCGALLGVKFVLRNLFLLCAPLPAVVRGAPLRAFYIFLRVAEFRRNFVVYICFLNIGMDDSARGQQQEWARKVANQFRERGSAEGWSAISGAGENSGGIPRPSAATQSL